MPSSTSVGGENYHRSNFEAYLREEPTLADLYGAAADNFSPTAVAAVRRAAAAMAATMSSSPAKSKKGGKGKKAGAKAATSVDGGIGDTTVEVYSAPSTSS